MWIGSFSLAQASAFQVPCEFCSITSADCPNNVAPLGIVAKVAIMDRTPSKTLSAREAKNRFGYLIDMARQEPVSIEKHGRPVVVVVSVEDYERMSRHNEKNKKDRD